MGLLPGRKRRRRADPLAEVMRPALAQVPDPSTLDPAALCMLPDAWPALDAAGRQAVLDPETAPDTWPRMIESGDPAAAAWGAQLQGTALVTSTLPGGPEWCSGLALLVAGLHCGYKDVTAMAAWQLSIPLGHGGPAFAEASIGYARLATALGAPVPLLAVALTMAEDPAEQSAARAIAMHALATMPAASLPAYRAGQVLAILGVQEQPAGLRAWYAAARVAVPEAQWTEGHDLVAECGWFTIDSGHAAISTRVFAQCPAGCFAEHPFHGQDGCGRSPGTVAAVPHPAGTARAVRLRRSGGDRTADTAVAVLALLAPEFTRADASLTPQALAAILARGAPLVLGTLAVDQTLYVSDAAAGFDTFEIIVDVDVEDVDVEHVDVENMDVEDVDGYSSEVAKSQRRSQRRSQRDAPRELVAAAWVAPPVEPDGPWQVLALGAFDGPIAAALRSAPQPEDAATLLRARPTTVPTTVQTTVPTTVPTPPAIERATSAALANLALDWERDRPRALSWLAAASAAGSRRAADTLARERPALDDGFADALERRGRRTLDPRLLAGSRDRQARSLLATIRQASSPRTRSRRVARLARHPSRWVRRAVAGRGDLKAQLALQLATDTDEHVRWSLIQQPAVPVEILVALAQDRSAFIRDAVAAHPRTPPSTRARLRSRPPTPEPAGLGAFARALARGDRAGALAALEAVPAGADGEDRAMVLAACQAALIFDAQPSDPLTRRVHAWADDDRLEVAMVAGATWRACQAHGRGRAGWMRRAAQAMAAVDAVNLADLRLGRACILAEAAWQLDGAEAAEGVLASLGPEGDQWIPISSLRTRIAAEAGDWDAVLGWAEPCLVADPCFATQVRPAWLRAAQAASWDQPRVLRQLTTLPPHLQDGQTAALLGSLQFARGDLAQACSAWSQALASGWTDITPTFIRALPELALPAQQLHALAQGSAELAVAVAGNPSVPADLLGRLARSPQPAIRRAVAGASACPVEVMQVLVDDPDPGVRSAIRDHPNCPPGLRVQARLTL